MLFAIAPNITAWSRWHNKHETHLQTYLALRRLSTSNPQTPQIVRLEVKRHTTQHSSWVWCSDLFFFLDGTCGIPGRHLIKIITDHQHVHLPSVNNPLVPLMACSPFLWVLANGNACCQYPCPMRLCWTLWHLSQYWHEGSPILHRVCGTSKLSPQSLHQTNIPCGIPKRKYTFVVELPWLGPHSLSFFRV